MSHVPAAQVKEVAASCHRPFFEQTGQHIFASVFRMGVQWLYDAFYPYFRGKRLDRFAAQFDLNGASSPKSVLDVGGCPTYWQYRRLPLDITCLNLPSYIPPSDTCGCKIVRGDGTALQYPDRSFEIAHSNGVIEHLGTWQKQVAFAREIRRVGRGLWVQTPAKSFPFECHTLDPFFHYLPDRYRRRFLRNFTLWGLLTRPTIAQVDEFLASTRPLTFEEMQTLFPDCTILLERFAGFVKSYVAFRPIKKNASPDPRASAASPGAACCADTQRDPGFVDLQTRRANLPA